jgi:hypothetical protein
MSEVGPARVAVLARASGAPALAATAQRRAVLALARIETVRMLRHPVTIAAALLLAAMWVSSWFTLGTSHYPVLQDLDRDSAIEMAILLGGAALIVGNLAVLRAHRDGTAGLSQVLILPDRARTVAHLLAPLAVAGLGAVLIALRMAVLAIWTPAAGHPNPYELASGLAIVLLLGALGVLVGRLTRSLIAGPLALLVVLTLIFVLGPSPTGGKYSWLKLQGGAALQMSVPVSLLGRPAGAHFAYLIGLAGLLAWAAWVRAGARGVRVAVAGVLALACAVAGGAAQLSTPDRATVAARKAFMNHPSEHQACRLLDHVTYCAFAGFNRWIPAWNTVVQAVVAQVPVTARSTPLTIRQRIVFVGLGGGNGPGQVLDAWRADDAAAGTPGAIGVDTEWGDTRSVANLAGQVAYRLVTGQSGEAHDVQSPKAVGSTACGGVGVLVGWLAGQAGAQVRSGLSALSGDAPHTREGGLLFEQNQLFPVVYVPPPENSVATQALARPRAEIAALVQQSWAALTAPGTTAAQAAQILGLSAPTGDPEPECG